jgi:hypothetical protein
MIPCPQCKGQGQAWFSRGTLEKFYEECARCKGTGKIEATRKMNDNQKEISTLVLVLLTIVLVVWIIASCTRYGYDKMGAIPDNLGIPTVHAYQGKQ